MQWGLLSVAWSVDWMVEMTAVLKEIQSVDEMDNLMVVQKAWCLVARLVARLDPRSAGLLVVDLVGL